MILQLLTVLSVLTAAYCDVWTHTKSLDGGKYQVHWTVEGDMIIFQTEVNSKGFSGLGLSTDGQLAGSDVVIGWVQNGKTHFHDMHGVVKNEIAMDQQQDWQLLESNENDTHTVLTFQRKLKTCDEQDVEIDQSTLRLIYMYSEEDPISAEHIHFNKAKKGVVSLILLSNKWPKLADGLPFWDVRASYHMTPKERSMYWCTVVKSPTVEKTHIVKIEPVIQAGSEKVVHHIDLRECRDAQFKDMLDFYVNLPGFDCHNSYHKKIYSACPTSLIAYGRGGKTVEFPEPLGLALKPSNYYVLEVHYDNALGINRFDNSGMNFTYTPKLRQKQGGVLFLGVTPNEYFMIPPRMDNFILAGHTKLSQFQGILPEGGIHLVSAMVHAHKLGRRVRARHFRNNVELKPIIDNKHYDFEYQTSELLDNHVHITEDDQLTVECEFNSTEVTTTTFGGHESSKEMCVILLYYYPRMQHYDCYTEPFESTLEQLTGEPIDRYFQRTMKNFDWSKIDMPTYQHYIQYTPQRSCIETGNYEEELEVSYPENYIPYSEPDVCKV